MVYFESLVLIFMDLSIQGQLLSSVVMFKKGYHCCEFILLTAALVIMDFIFAYSLAVATCAIVLGECNNV